MQASVGVNRVRSGDFDYITSHRLVGPGQGKRGLIAVHGRSANAFTWIPGWSGGEHARALIEIFGYVMCSTDFGGPNAWANNTALTAMDAAYTYLTTTMGCAAKVAVMGWSMGGLLSLNWLKRNPTKVAGLWCWAPATNVNYFHSGSYTSEIDTAYGGAGSYAANVVGHDPSTEAANYRGLSPIHIVHAQNDGTIPVQQSRDFVTAVNDPNVILQEVSTGDHTDPFSQIPTADFVSWMKGLTWT